MKNMGEGAGAGTLMDLRDALSEFSQMLAVGSTALEKLIASSEKKISIAAHLGELEQIASRLRTIGEQVRDLGLNE